MNTLDNKKMLLDLLHKYKPLESEEAIKDEMIAFLKKYDNCFSRGLKVGHFTASAWLVNKDCSHALLMHHVKLNMWIQLGGHCDGNSDVLKVAIKEAQEESGIKEIVPISKNIFDIDIHLIPSFKNEPKHYHYDVRFLLRVNSQEKAMKNRESHELKWISKNPRDLPTRGASILRMFEKWKAL